MSSILEVRNLKTSIRLENEEVSLVKGVDFSLDKGEVLGVVGESGSGKTLTGQSLLRLFMLQPDISITGEIIFKGEDLLQKTEKEMRKIRGREISMIFQEPMTSLNPVYTVGHQLMEMARLKTRNKKKQRAISLDMLKSVKISSPERVFNKYPHELSGGMRQRVMIGIALITNPTILIADELTTALDVTTQSQVLALIQNMQDQLKNSLIIITHDLGVIAEITDRVIVMYAGRIVEEGNVNQLFTSPLHPYTASLLSCIPRIDKLTDNLNVIGGEVPTVFTRNAGCDFYTRCAVSEPYCNEEVPPLTMLEAGRKSRCWRYEEFMRHNLIDIICQDSP